MIEIVAEHMMILEWKELHQYVRHELEIYFFWFTFFLTLLLGAIGWSYRASVAANGTIQSPLPMLVVVTLFSVQIMLGMVATEIVRRDLVSATNQAQALAEHLHRMQSGATGTIPPPRQAIPSGFETTLWLAQATLATNLVLWIAVTAYVFRKQCQSGGRMR